MIGDIAQVWWTLLTANPFSFVLVVCATIVAPTLFVVDVARGAFK